MLSRKNCTAFPLGARAMNGGRTGSFQKKKGGQSPSLPCCHSIVAETTSLLLFRLLTLRLLSLRLLRLGRMVLVILRFTTLEGLGVLLPLLPDLWMVFEILLELWMLLHILLAVNQVRILS